MIENCSKKMWRREKASLGFCALPFQHGLSTSAAPQDAAASEEEGASRAMARLVAERGEKLRGNVLLSILGSDQCKTERLVLTEPQSSDVSQPRARTASAVLGRRLRTPRLGSTPDLTHGCTLCFTLHHTIVSRKEGNNYVIIIKLQVQESYLHNTN